jgi:hypothetical protein
VNLKGQIGARGQETEGDSHIINQLRKIIDTRLPGNVKFLDGNYDIVDFDTAKTILNKYNDLRTSIEKEELTKLIWKSAAQMRMSS